MQDHGEARRSAAVRVRRRPTGRQRAKHAQTLTARTARNDGGTANQPLLPDWRKHRAQHRRCEVNDGSPRGRDAIGGSMRSTTARPRYLRGRTAAFHAYPDALGFVEPETRPCPNPRIPRTDSAHSREATESQSRRSGFAPMHGCGCAAPQKSAQASSRPRTPPTRRGAHFGRSEIQTRAAHLPRAPRRFRGPGRGRGVTVTRPRARLRALPTRRRSMPSPPPRLPFSAEPRRQMRPVP